MANLATCFDLAGELDLSHSRLKAILELMDKDLNSPSEDPMTAHVLVECAQMYEVQIAKLVQELLAATGATS